MPVCSPAVSVSDVADRPVGSFIFDRVDWTWLSADTSLLLMDGCPEVGFLQYRWDYYSELMMMYLLAWDHPRILCPSRPWPAWKGTTFEMTASVISALCAIVSASVFSGRFKVPRQKGPLCRLFQNSVIAPKYTGDLLNSAASTHTLPGPKGLRHRFEKRIWSGAVRRDEPIDGTVVQHCRWLASVFHKRLSGFSRT